jgi:hypothetical protein
MKTGGLFPLLGSPETPRSKGHGRAIVGRVRISRFSSSFVALALLLAGVGIARTAGAADDDESAEADGDEKEESDKKDDGGDKSSDKKDDDGEKGGDEKEEAFGHGGQFGLRVGLVGGYRMILRYDDSPYCTEPDLLKAANDQQKFCGHGAPFALTAGLSYGLFDFLEPFAWGRFGLAAEEETDTEPVLMLGAGVRVYTMSDAPFKIFIEPAVGVELEGGQGTAAWQANNPKYTKDLVLHLAAGPNLDFSRNVGAYLTAGITTSIFRALASSLDVELGIQGRI